MTSDELPRRRRLTDPRELRALAHPTRLALLDLLDREGPLTASRCGEQLGLSPKVCSFHLHTLAEHGFVEEAGRQGRRRPWRRVAPGPVFVDDPADPAELSQAADALSRLVVERDARLVDAFLDRRRAYPARWRAAAALHNRTVHLTAEELAELGQAVDALVERHAAAAAARPRPPGALPVRVVVYAFPSAPPDGR
jgi:DNA-binding transcriptional ArsR family regulator